MCLHIAIDRPGDVIAEGTHAGFDWMVIHNGRGYRCGYVRLPAGHPWHGKDYEETSAEVDVHGGITFGAPDRPCDGDGPDNAYWIGFDCNHCDDAADPTLPGSGPYLDFGFACESYVVRTQEYVEAQCRSLCEQAAKMNP